MRPIKFRLWDKVRATFDKEYKVEYDPNFSVSGSEDIRLSEIFDRDDVIFMQFTGLLDKNGKQIFEGDIVYKKSSFRDREGKGVVKWEKYGFVVEGNYDFPHYDAPWDFFSEEQNLIEIIGNIYENQELLSGNK